MILPSTFAIATVSPILPSPETIDYIYVLAAVAQPKNPANQPSVTARPRIKLWAKGTALTLSDNQEDAYRNTRTQVLAMLDNTYRSVDSYAWYHGNHHVSQGEQSGGIVLKNGSTIGWLARPGGLGYFDFDYDPNEEKLGGLSQRTNERIAVRKGRIYRVRKGS